MRKILDIFKQSMHIVAITVLAIMLCLYVVAHFNLAGIAVETDVREKMCEKLHARVEMGTVEVNWLNQMCINQLVIFDQKNDTMFCARRVMIALEVIPLLHRKLEINTVQLVDFQWYIKKETPTSAPNYSFIVEALMPKSDSNSQRRFLNDISLHSLFLRQGQISYDVASEPRHTRAIFPDKNHLFFNNISAVLSLNVNHQTGMEMTLKRMSLTEKSGFTLREFHGKAALSGTNFSAKNLSLQLSKELSDGQNALLSAKGEISLTDNTANLQLNSIDIEAGIWGDMHARSALIIPLDSLSKICGQTEFLPSRLTRQTADAIMQEFGFTWPMAASPYIDQISSLRWNGIATINSNESIEYDGNIKTEGLLNSKFSARISNRQNCIDSLEIELNGDIASVKYDNHLYHDISIDGSYEKRRIQCSFSCLDPICNVKGNAVVQLTDTATLINGQTHIRNIDPTAMRLTDISNIDGVTFEGFSNVDIAIDNSHENDNKRKARASKNLFNGIPTGAIRIDSLTIHRADEHLHLGAFQLTHQKEQNTSVIALISPIANIVATPTSTIGFIPVNPRFAQILKLPGTLIYDATFQAEWDTVQHLISAKIDIPKWANGEDSCSLMLTAKGPTSAESPRPLNLETDILFEYNNQSHRLESNLAATYEPEPLQIKLKPSSLGVDGKRFSTSNAVIREGDSGNYLFENLHIADKNQRLAISGSFSNEDGIDMQVHADNWQLDFFLDMLRKGYLDFGGYATGDFQISSKPTLLFQAQSVQVDTLTYIGTQLREGQISFSFDADRSHLLLSADIQSAPERNSHIDCDVQLHEVHDTIDLKFQIDSLPIDFLHYWIGGALEDLHGHASGDVRVYGDVDSLNLTGRPLLQNVNFTNSVLGARFYVTDTLTLTTDSASHKGYVGLNNATVTDVNGQKAVLTLDLEHDHLHDLEYGVDIDIPETPNGVLVFDHPTQKDGALFWGRLWATGRCQMHGNSTHHRISLQMAPAGRSVFYLSPGEENFTENAYNFLTFRDKDLYRQTEEQENRRILTLSRLNNEKKEESSYVEADLLIHANERCQVFVQMDPLAEDRLICKGNGDLSLHYDPFHDINLTGNYGITSGSYTVTMKGDVMTKAFQLQPGSRISFPGSPSEAELDLKAIYNIPSANLKDLDESFASVASLSRTTLPVDCKLNVTGLITAPQIAFDLEVKNTSDDVQALVHNIIGTQEMLNREVLYLLLFSKFYTPEYASTSQRQTGSELTSFASSSLTSQLNNLLGHMSDNFTLGTNFRSDKGDFSDMEMDVSVSTRLLNDRLLMTGNLGYRDPANSIGLNNTNTTFIGDFDVEFLINTRGTVRAKAYSHYNERDYSINNALTTQGIGIILRKDFKNLLDLLKRKQ